MVRSSPARKQAPVRAAWCAALAVAVVLATPDTARANVARVGEPAPAFQLSSLDGTPHRLSDYEGRIVLLDFWASWCGPCLRLMDQVLKPMHAQYAGDDRFALIGIGLAGRGESPQKQAQLAEQRGYDWIKLFDGAGTTARAYGVQAIPHLVLLDETGQVVAAGAASNQLVESIQQYLATRLGEADLTATADTPIAVTGASAGGWANTAQILVLGAVIILVIVMSLRSERRKYRASGPAGAGGDPRHEPPVS